MAGYSLRPHHCGYDLLLDGIRVGLVYREPDPGFWVIALTEWSSRADAVWQRFADVPAVLREACAEEHPTLAGLCAALGVVIGGLPTPEFREAA